MARYGITLIEYRGKRWLVSELTTITGIPSSTIRKRLSDGWTMEQALGTPTPKQRRAGVVSNLPAFEGTGGGEHRTRDNEFKFLGKWLNTYVSSNA